MATSASAGFSGKVYISQTAGGTDYIKIGETRDATFTFTNNEIDATSYDSGGWLEYIYGLKGWELSAESLLLQNDIGQYNAWQMPFTGVKRNFRFAPDTAGTLGYEGAAIINTFEVGDPVDDALVLTLNIMGTGALSEWNQTADPVV